MVQRRKTLSERSKRWPVVRQRTQLLRLAKNVYHPAPVIAVFTELNNTGPDLTVYTVINSGTHLHVMMDFGEDFDSDDKDSVEECLAESCEVETICKNKAEVVDLLCHGKKRLEAARSWKIVWKNIYSDGKVRYIR